MELQIETVTKAGMNICSITPVTGNIAYFQAMSFYLSIFLPGDSLQRGPLSAYSEWKEYLFL
jgi:hypothetical protein